MPFGIVHLKLGNAGNTEPLSATPLFVAMFLVQTQGGGSVASINTGRVWIDSATVSSAGTTGLQLSVPSAAQGAPAASFEDPCGRNIFNLQDFYVVGGAAGDSVVILYWQNPALSDRDMLIEMQYHLLETPADGSAPDGATLLTNRWAVSDWRAELDSVYKELAGASRAFHYIGTQVIAVGTADYSLDSFFPSTVCGANLVDILRLAYIDANGVSRVLQPSDSWTYDHVSPLSTAPQAYSLVTTGTRTLRLYPTPTAAGTLHVIFTGFGLDLDGSGNMFSLPDELVPFVKWGALGGLLSYDGQGADPARALYCNRRFQEGVEAARLLTGDWYA